MTGNWLLAAGCLLAAAGAVLVVGVIGSRFWWRAGVALLLCSVGATLVVGFYLGAAIMGAATVALVRSRARRP